MWLATMPPAFARQRPAIRTLTRQEMVDLMDGSSKGEREFTKSIEVFGPHHFGSISTTRRSRNCRSNVSSQAIRDRTAAAGNTPWRLRK
jgi:hypothetical protein